MISRETPVIHIDSLGTMVVPSPPFSSFDQSRPFHGNNDGSVSNMLYFSKKIGRTKQCGSESYLYMLCYICIFNLYMIRILVLLSSWIFHGSATDYYSCYCLIR